jgi:hypothetical protein
VEEEEEEEEAKRRRRRTRRRRRRRRSETEPSYHVKAPTTHIVTSTKRKTVNSSIT